MSEYLLDTNHLAYVQRKQARVLEKLEALPSDARVITSVIGVAELLSGVHSLPESRRRRELLALYHHVIGQMREVLLITVAVAEKFAEVEAELRRKGRPIPTNDIWLAALALVRGAILVTNDDHFSYVEGLSTENWTR